MVFCCNFQSLTVWFHHFLKVNIKKVISIILVFYRKDMRDGYNELQQINEELVHSYTVRVANHELLLEALRGINVIIQQAARLRGNTSIKPLLQLKHNFVLAMIIYVFIVYLSSVKSILQGSKPPFLSLLYSISSRQCTVFVSNQTVYSFFKVHC